MEADFARGEAANTADIERLREKVKKEKEGDRANEELIEQALKAIEDGSGAVEPKRDCPHCKPENVTPLADMIGKGI
jgi:hypothetical protein